MAVSIPFAFYYMPEWHLMIGQEYIVRLLPRGGWLPVGGRGRAGPRPGVTGRGCRAVTRVKGTGVRAPASTGRPFGARAGVIVAAGCWLLPLPSLRCVCLPRVGAGQRG